MFVPDVGCSLVLAAGLQIGKYELIRKLGEGGFGLVFVGRDVELDREVALKFMHPEHTANPEILRRFLQEARSAAKIKHASIVTIHECGQVSGTGTGADGIAFIAMELLAGETLSDRLARARRLQPDVATEIARQVASALEAAHQAGIVHRDLKPDNIFLVPDPMVPGGERVKVLDFGIAKLAQMTQSSVKTQSQMVFGTPRYMSPEQCRSAAATDHRSDIYTLGCILYELVTGQAPFDGETGELIAKHQLVVPPRARAVNPAIPERLDELIWQMLAKQPGERPQTMVAVQRALEAGGIMAPGLAATLLPDAAQLIQLAGPKQAVTPRAAVPTTLGGASSSRQVETQKRSPLRVALIALGGIALAGAGTWIGLQIVGGAPPRANQPEPPRAAAPAPTPAQAPPDAAAEIVINLVSTPSAEVFSVPDNLLRGETPYVHKRMPTAGKLVFLLKATGYQDERVVVDADRSATHTVELVAIAKPVEKTIVKPPKILLPPKPPKSTVCEKVKCSFGFTCRATDGACVPDTIKVD